MRKYHVLSIYMLLLLVLLGVQSIPMEAATQINQLNIDVVLQDDGSAHITQKWDVQVDKGTEFYLPIGNLKGMEITNFQVKDESGTLYEMVQKWDSRKSKEEKAFKSGILDKGNGSYELVWGIGSYGAHTYTFEYTLKGFVMSYQEADGFNQQLINSKSDLSIDKLEVRISKPGYQFTDANSKIWAFGFDGDIQFQNGAIIARNTKRWQSKFYLNVLVQIEKGVFTPTNIQNTSFDEVKNKAFEGSQYKRPTSVSFTFFNRFWIPIGLFIFFGLMTSITRLGSSSHRPKPFLYRKYKIYKSLKHIDYYRDITFDHDIGQAAWALTEIGRVPNAGNIISSFLLKWLKEGKIKFGRDIQGKKEQSYIMFLVEDTTEDQTPEQLLFRMLSKISGPEQILREKMLKKWSQRNAAKIQKWFKLFDMTAGDQLLAQQDVTIMKVIQQQRLTEQGIEKTKQLLGLNKFLLDYSLIATRTPNEVVLWDDYLIFASLFGIADKVAEEFKKIAPDYFINYQGLDGDMDVLTSLIMIRSFSRIYSAPMTTESFRGMGGGTSFGGGGGFSGGGSGGGVR